MELKEIALEVAHRTCTKYLHVPDSSSIQYSFSARHLVDFVEKLIAEAEATKPISHQITSGGAIPEWTDEDKARLGVALEQMKQMRVTKPQEPVAWVNPRCDGDIEWNSAFTLLNGAELFAAPQPCKRCAELEADARKAAMDSLAAEWQLDERIKELEAERDEEREARKESDKEVNNYHELTQQLKAERDEYRTKYQINAARSDERCKQLCEMESERDALAMYVDKLRNALDHYAHGGSAFRKVAADALAIPVLFADVVKRHDAAVIRGAADFVKNWHSRHGIGCSHNLDAANDLLKMAEELEKS